MSDADEFPHDVVELMDFMSDQPRQHIRAVPGTGAKVPVWILGSSLFGAQLAAMLGLPYAFASHFAPAQMMQAIELYRENFKPSAQLAKPYVMLGFNVFAADTDEEAQVLRHLLAAGLRQPAQRPARPRCRRRCPATARRSGPRKAHCWTACLSCAAIGSPDTVRDGLKDFIERTGADELMITSQMFDHAARLRSYEITAQVRAQLA